LATPQQRQTKSGLLPEAAHVILPKGIASNGFPSTEQVCQRLGIVFDPWQRDLNRCILAKTRTGLYAADTVLLSIPRQVGKTFDVGGVVFADSVINAGTTTVWTAHRFKVARESFNEMRAWAKSPLLAPHIDYDDITTAAGNECIPFRNGSRIMFAARERGAVRGFTKVRRLVLDEGQILTEQALADLVPTMNQAVNPQLILMCTPPKPTDPGEVVNRLRAEALGGDSEGVLYVELSAPRDSAPDDRSAWRKANPSYPKRTPARAILRMRKLLTPSDFCREALGIWDTAEGRKIDPAQWADRADPASQITGPVALAFAVAPDASSWPGATAIAVGGRRADGLGHGELTEPVRHGTAGLVDRLVTLAEAHDPCVLAMNPVGAAGAFVKELNERGFAVVAPGKELPPGKRWRLQMTGPREFAQACGALADDVRNGQWRHLGQGPLDDAMEGARTRPLAEAWAWSWQHSLANIVSLESITLARHGHATFGVAQGQFFGSWR
jgi:hypothetical protein